MAKWNKHRNGTTGHHVKKIAYNDSNELYKRWRMAVCAYYECKCQMCGKRKRVHAHHVYSKFNYPHIAFLVDNGIALCEDCHIVRVHDNGETCFKIEMIKIKLKQIANNRGLSISYNRLVGVN